MTVPLLLPSEIFALIEKEHEESTKVKNIKVIEMGAFEIDTWYHLAVVYDSTKTNNQLQLFINGEQDEVKSYTSSRSFLAGLSAKRSLR